MKVTWKSWILLGSLAFHLVLITALKIPDILARHPDAMLVFNLLERPEINKPLPPPPLPEKKEIEKIRPEKKELKKEETKQEKKDDAPPPPPAPASASPDPADESGPVVNPEPGAAPGGAEGGVPGGIPGGTGDAAAPEKPSPPPEPEKPKVDTVAILSMYSGSIKSKVQSAKFYPEEAKRMEHEGTVKVRFTVSASGSVSSASVSASSGFSDLDNAAISAVKNAAPFGAIPAELEKSSLSLTISLKYYLK